MPDPAIEEMLIAALVEEEKVLLKGVKEVKVAELRMKVYQEKVDRLKRAIAILEGREIQA